MKMTKLAEVLNQLLVNNNSDPNVDPSEQIGYGMALNDVADMFDIELVCLDEPGGDRE